VLGSTVDTVRRGTRGLQFDVTDRFAFALVEGSDSRVQLGYGHRHLDSANPSKGEGLEKTDTLAVPASGYRTQSRAVKRRGWHAADLIRYLQRAFAG
jgi:hypothetical protein